MGAIYLVFYFILLLQSTESQQSDEPSCNETCGNVTIPSPFGIESGCYNNSWFRVTCNNETAYGPKPYISRINLELLGPFDYENNYMTVNNPVTYLNCGNKGTTATASVNLEGSPFYFSGYYNMFGSVGCGNWATVYSNISDEPIAGCLQPRCGDLTSNIGNCYAEIISEDLVSYTTTIREIIDYGKLEHSRRCASAFMFDASMLNCLVDPIGPTCVCPDFKFPDNISIETTHVPAILGWNTSVECDLGGQHSL
ncbi:hypothetical protein PTKIN_Ptkin09bG0247600 [Pterospermum kingtungense]